MSKPRILVSDNLAQAGVEALEAGGLDVDVRTGLEPEELAAIIGPYDGLVVRSKTKATAAIIEAAGNLKIIGRAGVGVDNIDREAATRRGIVVMNAPGGSSVTVAEHTMAMMLAAARHLPAATATLKAGRWDKKKFQGHQLAGMVLGVVGLGRIGSAVVERARAFGMRVLAYDPFLSADVAHRLGVELVPLDDIWERVDFLTFHLPLTPETKHLVNDQTLARMKQGAYVINCARGGIVDEAALARALESGHLGGAAVDVFETEPPPADNPLFALDNVVLAPHLGASTYEAQAMVAVQLAEQIAAFFRSGEIQNGVNVASVSSETMARLGPWLEVASHVGAIAAQLGPVQASQVTVLYAGDVTRHHTEPLTNHVLMGLLRASSFEPVNMVNARPFARARGLVLEERRTEDPADYSSTVGVRLATADDAIEVVGTVFGRSDLRIVRIDEYVMDAEPRGHLLVISNDDQPGTLGEIGRVLGTSGINIGRIHLSRSAPKGRALAMVNVDSEAPPEVLERLRGLEHVLRVEQMHLA